MTETMAGVLPFWLLLLVFFSLVADMVRNSGYISRSLSDFDLFKGKGGQTRGDEDAETVREGDAVASLRSDKAKRSKVSKVTCWRTAKSGATSSCLPLHHTDSAR